MADNTVLNSGSGGDTLRTDDDGTAKHPVSKISLGIDGSFDGFVATTNPLPVKLSNGTSQLDPVLVDDAAFSIGSDAVVAMGAVLDDTLPDSVDEGDVGVVRMSANRNLYCQIRDAAGNERGLNVDANGDVGITNSDLTTIAGAVAGTEMQVDIVSGSVSITGAVDTELPGAAQITGENNAAPTAPSIYAFGLVFDGTAWDRLPGTSADGMLVNLGSNNDVTVSSGTVSISGTVTVDSELPAAATLTDNFANPTAPGVGAFAMLWDGAAWDRAPGNSADGMLVNLGSNNDVTVSGSIDTELPSAAALADDAANPTAPAVGSFGMVWDGATWDRMPGTSANGVKVDITQSVALDASAATVTVDLGANNDVQGSAAHDAAVSGNPFLQAAEARSSEATAVANGDVVRLMADVVGKLVNQPFAPTDLHWQNTGSKTDTTDLALAAAAGVGVKNYLTDIICANTSSTDTTVIIKDGATEIARIPVPANGGAVHRFGVPLKTSANTALNAASAAGVSTMYITGSGFTGR